MNNNIPLFTPDEAMAEQGFIGDAMVKLWRRKWSVLGIGLCLFLILAVAIQALPKIYHGKAMVEADAATPQAIPVWSQMRDQQFSDYTLGTEMTILESPELLTTVIQKLKLTDDPEYNPSLRPTLLSDLSSRYHRLLAEYLPNNEAPPINPEDARLGTTLATLLTKVSFEPVPHSRDVQITVSSRDNQKAALIANAIADAYLSSHLDFAEQIMRRVHNYTGQELTQLAREAASKAERVANFKTANGIVTGREANLLQEQISQVSTDLNTGRANLAALQGRYQAAQHADPESIGAVLGSPTIERLREQEAQIGAQRAGLSSNYSAGNPLMSRLNAQYADVQNKIRQEANRQIASLTSDIRAQTASVNSLQARLDELHNQYSKMTGALAQLVPIQGEADAASQSYASYAQTRMQTDASMLIPATTVRVVSHAAVPLHASFPNNMIMLPAAFAFSFAFAGLIGWTREARRKGVVSTYEIESALDVETLGLLPLRTSSNELMYRDAIEQLLNRIWLTNRPKTILVTSARPQEGKTTTALALAQAASEREQNVLLVDADMRSTRLSRNARMQSVGLGDVLRGQAQVADVVNRSGNLTMLPAGQPRGLPTRLFALDRFDQTMGLLKAQYDLIIIDAPPSFIGGDVWLLSQKVDRTLFIAKWGSTTPAQINEAIRKQLHHESLAGIVLNMVNTRQNMRYGYVDAEYYAPGMTTYYRHPRLQ
jgi:capsular exopolysaccharide synthesis family protein